MNRRSAVGLGVGILISAIGLWYAFRLVDPAAVVTAMSRVGPEAVLASVGFAVLSHVIRAARWRFLLVEGARVTFRSLVSATFIGIMANNLLPARIGELVRAWILARRAGFATPTVLASVVVERLLDVATVVVLLGIALLVVPALGGERLGLLQRGGAFVLVGMAAGTAVLAAVARGRDRVRSLAAKPGWWRGILRCLAGFADGLVALRTPWQITIVIILSFLVWGAVVASFHVLAASFRLSLSLAQTTLVVVIVLFGITIPSAPGFVGTFHGFCVAGLGLIGGIDPTRAAAYATVLHGSGWIAINAVGLLCLVSDRSIQWTAIARGGVLSQAVRRDDAARSRAVDTTGDPSIRA